MYSYRLLSILYYCTSTVCYLYFMANLGVRLVFAAYKFCDQNFSAGSHLAGLTTKMSTVRVPVPSTDTCRAYHE